MIARLEVKYARLAVTGELDVRALIAAVGHRVVQQVRQFELPALERALHQVQFLLGACEPLHQRLALA